MIPLKMKDERFPRNEELLSVRAGDAKIVATQQMGYFERNHR